MASETVSNLEADALKRKERLLALKRKRDEASGNTSKSDDNDNRDKSLPKPKFRSYRPEDENLHENVIDNAKPANVEEIVQEQLNAGRTKVVIEELDLTTLAPRKPDWDLKRDVSEKLQKLERRTQRAIAELIRDRLKENQTGSNLAEAVALQGASIIQEKDDD